MSKFPTIDRDIPGHERPVASASEPEHTGMPGPRVPMAPGVPGPKSPPMNPGTPGPGHAERVRVSDTMPAEEGGYTEQARAQEQLEPRLPSENGGRIPIPERLPRKLRVTRGDEVLEEGEVERETYAPTLARKDSTYTEITADQLPSGFYFYPYDSLSIRRFRLADLKKMYHAQATNSFRAMVQVINSTIDRDAMELTANDFWYLMYWHRINSYLKSPLMIEYNCRDTQHLKDVADEKKDQASLHGSVALNQSVLDILRIEDEEALGDYVIGVQENSPHHTLFYPARVIDTVESIEMIERLIDVEQLEAKARQEEQLLREADPEQLKVIQDTDSMALKISKQVSQFMDEDWWNTYASVIHPRHGKTLQERRHYLDQLSEADIGQDFIDEAEEFMRLARHGVRETVTINCRGCGAKIESPVSIDALSFFPHV